ncbi:hypothetical protein PAPYR_9470 [Paratrimastix pyriformis]|uniref:EGF-like domain-containing protein n=1 Tax=Paratrimastix pyriformis TaxID=342808 RepID=A0ABQ8U9Z5_9EUKA|nr:hypothetical protein PAPYR_9470 [Paratrimastix pyriformis]
MTFSLGFSCRHPRGWLLPVHRAHVGSVTRCSVDDGCAGQAVSAANSLVGVLGTPVGQCGTFMLPGGSYALWACAGLLTYCPASGCVGAISDVDSLVLPQSGRPFTLASGHVAFAFPTTGSGLVIGLGQAGGFQGTPSSHRIALTDADALMGTSTYPGVGTKIYDAGDGDYWVSGTKTLTWCRGSAGCRGQVGPANSLLADWASGVSTFLRGTRYGVLATSNTTHFLPMHQALTTGAGGADIAFVGTSSNTVRREGVQFGVLGERALHLRATETPALGTVDGTVAWQLTVRVRTPTSPLPWPVRVVIRHQGAPIDTSDRLVLAQNTTAGEATFVVAAAACAGTLDGGCVPSGLYDVDLEMVEDPALPGRVFWALSPDPFCFRGVAISGGGDPPTGIARWAVGFPGATWSWTLGTEATYNLTAYDATGAVFPCTIVEARQVAPVLAGATILATVCTSGGVFEVHLVPMQTGALGSLTLSTTYNAATVPGSTSTSFAVEAPALGISETLSNFTSAASQRVGLPYSVRVVARDSAGTLVACTASTAALAFSLSRDRGTSLVAIAGVAWSCSAEGYFVGTFTQTIATEISLVVLVASGGAAVAGSPKRVTFTADAFYLPATMFNPVTIAAGATVTLPVRARDRYNNTLPCTTATANTTFALIYDGAAPWNTVTWTCLADGAYQAVWRPNPVAGTHTLAFAVPDVDLEGPTCPPRPVTITHAMWPDSAQTSLTVSPTVLAAGSSLTLTGVARDTYGNLFPCSSMYLPGTFYLVLSWDGAPVASPGWVWTCGGAGYTWVGTWTPGSLQAVAGPHALDLKFLGTSLAGCPVQVNVTDGPAPICADPAALSTSTTTFALPDSLPVGTTMNVTISAHTAAGLTVCCTNVTAPSLFAVAWNGTSPLGIVWSCAGTSFVGSFVPGYVAGNYSVVIYATTIAAASNGRTPLAGTPVMAMLKPGAPDARNTVISAPSNPPAVRLGHSLRVTVAPRDIFGNGIGCTSATAGSLFTLVWDGAAPWGVVAWYCAAAAAANSASTAFVGEFTPAEVEGPHSLAVFYGMTALGATENVTLTLVPGTPCTTDQDCASTQATCTGGAAPALYCTCPKGRSGALCQTVEGICTKDKQCLHGGSCVGSAPNKRCNCTLGWTGDFCDTAEVEIRYCTDNASCQTSGDSGASCIMASVAVIDETVRIWSCACSAGATGGGIYGAACIPTGAGAAAQVIWPVYVTGPLAAACLLALVVVLVVVMRRQRTPKRAVTPVEMVNVFTKTSAPVPASPTSSAAAAASVDAPALDPQTKDPAALAPEASAMVIPPKTRPPSSARPRSRALDQVSPTAVVGGALGAPLAVTGPAEACETVQPVVLMGAPVLLVPSVAVVVSAPTQAPDAAFAPLPPAPATPPPALAAPRPPADITPAATVDELANLAGFLFQPADSPHPPAAQWEVDTGPVTEEEVAALGTPTPPLLEGGESDPNPVGPTPPTSSPPALRRPSTRNRSG